jgi:ribonuclease P protein component
MARSKASRTPSARPDLLTLKRRTEFTRVRGGSRWATKAFVLEGKPRAPHDGSGAVQQARFGFTVTKRLGKAVARNRIRRRLRAAARDVLAHHARPDFDYVVVARASALDADYAELVCDLTKALAQVHRVSESRTRRPAGR